MSNELTLNASLRQDTGKGASRRLRRLAQLVPGIVYGGDKEPQNISVVQKDLVKALEQEAFYSQIIDLNIDGSKQKVILRDLQRHPSKVALLHIDFQRVSADQKLQTRVPLHFLNEDVCIGVKMQGGFISQLLTELEIICLPGDLPEAIEVDMANLEVDQVIHISDLSLPAGVESVALQHGADYDQAVATVHKARGAAADEAEGEGEEGGESTDATE